MLRKALLVLSGNAAASLLLLARNLIIARMIPVEDYGVAATFAVAMAVIEMASAFGLQQQIVQSKEGDNPHFQAVLQGFQLLRGVIGGLVLFLISGPMARFLGIPEVIWAYQVLAIVPVLNALVHFDIHRMNRRMRYGPMILTGVLPALASLALVWPLAQWLGDWRVTLWTILVQAMLRTVTSHLVAERHWRVAFDRDIMVSSLRFGWPLLLNTLMMFLVFQGDKLIVGRLIGMEALAIFAMGMTLSLTPTLVMAKSAQNLFLPRLSQLQAEAGTPPFQALAHATLQAAILNGAIVILAINLAGVWLVTALFNGKYDALLPLLTAFGLLNGLRVFKAGPAVIGMACGHTANAMLANLPRVAVLPLAWMLIDGGGTLAELLWLGIGAELAGFGLSVLLVVRRPGLALRPLLGTALALAAFGLANSGLPMLPDVITGWHIGLVQIFSFVLLLASMRTLWHVFLRYSPPAGPPPL